MNPVSMNGMAGRYHMGPANKINDKMDPMLEGALIGGGIGLGTGIIVGAILAPPTLGTSVPVSMLIGGGIGLATGVGIGVLIPKIKKNLTKDDHKVFARKVQHINVL